MQRQKVEIQKENLKKLIELEREKEKQERYESLPQRNTRIDIDARGAIEEMKRLKRDRDMWRGIATSP